MIENGQIAKHETHPKGSGNSEADFEILAYESRSTYQRWKDAAYNVFERLRRTQLREGSLYSQLRSCIPLIACAVVWLWAVHWSLEPGYRNLFYLSITVRHLILALGIFFLWNFCLRLTIFTRRSARKDLQAELWRLLVASLCCGMLPVIGNLDPASAAKGNFLSLLTVFALFTLSLLLIATFALASALSPRMLRPRTAVLVGTGRRAQALQDRLRNHYSPFRIIGCVDDIYLGKPHEKTTYLGKITDLERLLKEHPIEVVLIGLPVKSMYDQIQKTIDTCEIVGVESHYMTDIFDTARAVVQHHPQEPHKLAVLSSFQRDPRRLLKRALDFTGAVILLLLASPIMAAAALAIFLTSAGPVFFVQQRYGLNRDLFPMFKFRTMVIDAEIRQAALEGVNEAQGPVFKLKSDPRVTRVGQFLRRTSIDELPQLFNVLRGDMSLVGPRPLPMRDVSRFEASWLLRRFSVKPGLTCLWQVNGRSNTSFDYWIQQDLQYIDTWSLVLDVRILFKTIPAVFRGSGAM